MLATQIEGSESDQGICYFFKQYLRVIFCAVTFSDFDSVIMMTTK